VNNFNTFEKQMAKFLSNFPQLKKKLKRFYQRILYFKFKKNYNYSSSYPINKLVFEQKETFFGYYDKSPINQTNEYIIFHASNIETNQLPNPKIPVDIILYDIINDEFKIIDRSFAYNWQQGSRLMWCGEYKFIYNVFEDNEYKSKIYDIKNKSFKIINFPIYDVYKDEFAISLNFERLDIGRGDYAYKNRDIDCSDNKNDGLYFIDLEKNEKKLILSLEDVIKIHYKDSMKNAKHKFNHIMISPNGEKIMFMHRWFDEKGKRYDSLLVSNVDGSNVEVIADKEMVSHCYWYDNENIFGYLREFDGDRFYMINVNTLEKKVIGKNVIDKYGDGHPSIYKEKVIFDTYPDKARMLHLFMYDLKNKNLEELGEFFQPFDFYEETRCDLHPRFSFDGKKVFFDSVHEGRRYLYMMELEK
jgi:hypothetical protein